MKLLFCWLVMASFMETAYSQSRFHSEAGNIRLGSRFKIDVSQDGKERQFPFVDKFGNNIFISFSEHRDAIITSPTDAMMISRNNGKTWREKITNKNFYFTSMFKEGSILYGIVYFTYPLSASQERMVYWTSDDEGKTWVNHQGIVNAPAGYKFKPDGIRGIWGNMLFHRGMMVMQDGSIQGAMYGSFDGDKKSRTIWVKSTDSCKTWNVISTISLGYTEPNVVRVKDGSLLCVMRVDSYLPLHQCRSYDNGLTWTKPIALPGLPDSVSESVDPNMLLMKSGVLALSYGRPGDKMAFSTDGCGYKWDVHLNTYTGVTTGYTGIVGVKRNTLLLIADQGANWSKGVNEKAIWGRFIHVGLKPRSPATDKNKKEN